MSGDGVTRAPGATSVTAAASVTGKLQKLRQRLRRRAHAPAHKNPLVAALAAVLDGDLDAAERLLAARVREDSTQVESYLLLAQLYRRRGETGRAIHIHQNLLLRGTLSAAEKLNTGIGLARDFERGGFLARALAAWRSVLQTAPQHEDALRAVAKLAAKLHDFELAITVTRKLARRAGAAAGPPEAKLLVQKAQAARAAGRETEARRTLRRALRRDAENAQAWEALGDLEAARGRVTAARSAWQRCATLDPRALATVTPKLAGTADAQATPEARAALTKFLRGLREQETGELHARLALASHLSAGGDTEGALAELAPALEEQPESLPLQGLRARILLAAGREGEAVKALRELLRVLDAGGALAPRERLE